MPYIQKGGYGHAQWMGLVELVELVQAENGCDVEDARTQISNALADSAIWPLDWEPAPIPSDYCEARLGSSAPILGKPVRPPPPSSQNHDDFTDRRSVTHWRNVQIAWEQGQVLDDFEHEAYPRLNELTISPFRPPGSFPKPRSPEWRTLWLDREACKRIWPPAETKDAEFLTGEAAATTSDSTKSPDCSRDHDAVTPVVSAIPEIPDDVVPLGLVHNDENRDALMARIEKVWRLHRLQLWGYAGDFTASLKPVPEDYAINWLGGPGRENGNHPEYPGLTYYCDVSASPRLRENDPDNFVLHAGWRTAPVWTQVRISQSELDRLRHDVQRVRDIPGRSFAVPIATPPHEIDPRQKDTRARYGGDLATFMARKGLKLMQRMPPKDIAKSYIEDHQRRERQGDAVPRLPSPSNRLTRIAKQAEKIRHRMEAEADRRTTSNDA